MKKKWISLALIIMLILGMAGSTAVAEERPANVVSTNVLSLLEGVINVEYEKVFNPGMSLYASPRVLIGGALTGFGMIVGIKKYLNPTAPEGLWFGGHGNFAYVSAGTIVSATGFGGGANAGYKYFLTDNFIIEGSLGLAYIYMSASVSGYTYAAGRTFGVTGRIGIGYAF
jgi:hypothetical protein